MVRTFLKSFIFFLFFYTSLLVSPLFAAESPLIRVAIAQDVPSVTIKMSGGYEISNPLTRQILEKSLGFGPSSITPGIKGLKIGDQQFALPRIRFYSLRDVSVIVYGKERRYRGAIDILLNANGTLLVVNQLEVEDYIKGVLSNEVSNHWPIEALKVQAVAARSYAYSQIQATNKKEFAVTNDIYSQVYGGRNSERYRTNIAIEQTKGEVLSFANKILPAYFHATCGGRTQDAAELWPKENSLPLKGVRCLYCRESPHYFWKRNIQLKQIQDKLIAHGYPLGLIEDIAISKRNASDRITTLIITERSGKQITISGKDFREILGPNLIRSNNYYIVMKGYFADFLGKGWGHGVGMCQWGAREMAVQGFRYDKILQFYYPGSKILVLKDADLSKAY